MRRDRPGVFRIERRDTLDRSPVLKRRNGGTVVSRILFAVLCGLALLCPRPATAGPALVFEPFDGTVVYAEDPDALWHPASITKLMTAYLTFEAMRAGAFNMDSEVVSSANANRQPPTRLGLRRGGKISVSLALRALMVKSANDVAVMLAEKVAGSEAAFVERMNATAKRLGMTRTRFHNPHGLPDYRQVTTARDMALLARALLKEYPEFNYLYSLQSVRFGRRQLRSHNGLLFSFEGADGMKTGFVCAAGYNVVASATRDGRKLVAVVLGDRTGGARNQRAKALLDYGFRRYWWKSTFGESIDSLTMEASLSAGPVNMRRHGVCSGRRKARRAKARKRKARRAKGRKRKRSSRTKKRRRSRAKRSRTRKRR